MSNSASDGPLARPDDAGGAVADSSRFETFAWVLLDWAASAFSTISITLLVAYIEKVVFAGQPWGVPGGVVWAWTLAVAMLVTALAAPWVAAWADRTHGHHRALMTSIVAGGAASFLLAALAPSARVPIVVAVVVAAVGFDMAAIFTGSLLPRIARGAQADRLSAIGYAAGYAGGAVALILATRVFAARASLGLTDAGALRTAFAIMGGWWIVFSIPSFWVRFGAGHSSVHAATSSGELTGFARALLRGDEGYGRLGSVLGGAMLILGAMQTAISQFSSVALEEFHLDPPALVGLVLLVQCVALPGALAVGWLSTRVGRWPMLSLSLVGWVIVLGSAGFVTTRPQLTAMAVLLALVLGGAASVIRAAVAVLAPAGRYGATFGLLNVGSKLAGFVASLVFGAVYAISGHPRAGLAALLVQLILGWWLLWRAGAGAMEEGKDDRCGV
ncbi:MAG: MFS transporter [Planctomycetia bacterium]